MGIAKTEVESVSKSKAYFETLSYKLEVHELTRKSIRAPNTDVAQPRQGRRVDKTITSFHKNNIFVKTRKVIYDTDVVNYLSIQQHKKRLPHYVEAAQLNAFLRGITYPQRMHKKSTFSIKVPQIHLQKPLKTARLQRFPKFCFLVLNRYRQVLQGINCCITDTEFVIKHKCG